MRIYKPLTVEALMDACAEAPGAVLLAGGTDVMVDINHDRLRPEAVIDVRRVDELKRWQRTDGALRIGSGVTFSQIGRELGQFVPALAAAARTVGSPQIRNRGTLGGDIGTASPAGDALPVLVATDAVIELGSVRGVRIIPARKYFIGPRQTVREPDECVMAVVLPVSPSSAQQFAKVGVRNAMVIAIASFALHVDPARGVVGTGLGSVAPIPLAAVEAERWFADNVFGTGASIRKPDDRVADRFADMVAEAASPIDDLRGTAAYRRHVLRAMAKRTVTWALADLEDATWN